MAATGMDLNCGGVTIIHAHLFGHTHVVKAMLELGARPVRYKALKNVLGEEGLRRHPRYLGVGVRPMISRRSTAS